MIAIRIALLVVPLLIVAGLMLRTGELLPMSVVARLQSLGQPILFLDSLSDRTYRLKVEGALIRRPEILVLGSSRTNQWRSAMFGTSTFYNAGNAAYRVGDLTRFLRELGDYSPRVMIFTVDYFMFARQFEARFDAMSYDDLGWGSREQLSLASKFMEELLKSPSALLPFGTERVHGVPALGLRAIGTSTGLRIDGSFQYGDTILGRQRVTPAEAAEGIRRGNQWPTLPMDALETDLKMEFEAFVGLAREKGIKLVGVTPPFAPEVLAALQATSGYRALAEFRSPATQAWLEDLGIVYFDFTDLDSIGGRAEEFVDPFHPSEPAYVRMLTQMVQDPRFTALLPHLDPIALSERLATATQYEVYGNSF